MDGDEHNDVEETSSKRRERLLALRAAANATPAAAPPSPAPAPNLLPDPDLAGDHQAAAPGAGRLHRFDYYTNPAAAFSSSSGGGGGSNPAYSHKRKSPPPGSYGPRPAPPPPQYCGTGNYGSNYPPPNQHYMAPSPMHPPSLMPHDAPGNSPWQGPMQFQDPSSGYQGTPGAPAWGPHSGSAGRGSYPNSCSFVFRHPNPGRGANPMSYRPRGSPHASYGRGRGQNYNSSPGSWGRGGGRGAVSFQYNSGEDRRSYINKSMVDDPWQDLHPIVGNILIPRAWGGSQSWLPESLREKKETSAHGQIKSTPSGLSLAEYLDLSFNEASNEA